jgi:aminopeptidase N
LWAAVPDAAHKAAAWALLAGRPDPGLETLAEVAAAFIQPEHAHLLGPYADRYFEALPDIWASNDEGGAGSFRLAFGHLLFPYPLASPELLARIDAFLGVADRDQDMARVVTEGRDVVERALRSRALPN